MVQAVAGEQALKQRQLATSGGKRGDGQLKEDQPQAFLVEMNAGETIVPHFHEVDQFQIFVAGSGGMGRNAAAPLVVHYADHHTGYGPINAGPQGYSYFTLRAKSDPGAHYLHKPGYRELLKPSRKRHATVSGIALSTEPVLMDRKDMKVEQLMPEFDGSDGLSAALLRMGPAMSQTGPNPQATGGQYYLVVNGSMELAAGNYSAWSTIYVARDDAPLAFKAGPKGLEALLLQFARVESQP
jgi:hypothetical protein